MKRWGSRLLVVLAMLLVVTAGAYAAPGQAATGKVGPYEGRFQGTAYGDENSYAPLALELTHRGSQVEGRLFLDEGLYVDGGFCGTVSLPATVQPVKGQAVRWNPNRLVASPTFDVGGFELAVDFESTVSTDGDLLVAKAKVDLPWFCGRDPALTATLHRE